MDLLSEPIQHQNLEKMKNKLKIMADYQCFPIWGAFDNYSGNINPELLPITDELKEMFSAWRIKYDETLNDENPASSGFRTKEQEYLFDNQGVVLWKALAEQMGELCDVNYFSELKNKEFTSMVNYLIS